MVDASRKVGGEFEPAVKTFPPTLVIAGATAAGYWLAHTYESAYLRYFHLPESLVRVGLNTTILATGTLVSAAWAAFGVAVIVFDALKGRFAEYHEVLFLLAVTVFNLVARLTLFGSLWKEWAPILGVLAVAVAVLILARRFSRKRALATQQAAPESAPAPGGAPTVPVPATVANPSVARVLLPWIGREGLIIIYVLFLARSLAQDAGRAAAEQASEFLTLRDQGAWVVLRAYDEVLVAASYDPAAHTVGPGVMLVSPAKTGTVALKRETLGRLHPVAVPDRSSIAPPALPDGGGIRDGGTAAPDIAVDGGRGAGKVAAPDAGSGWVPEAR